MSACFPLCASTQMKSRSHFINPFRISIRMKEKPRSLRSLKNRLRTEIDRPQMSQIAQIFVSIVSGKKLTLVFEPVRATVFALVVSGFGNQTVLGFWMVQELALWHIARRTGRRAVGPWHHECGFSVFFLNHMRDCRLISYQLSEGSKKRFTSHARRLTSPPRRLPPA